MSPKPMATRRDIRTLQIRLGRALGPLIDAVPSDVSFVADATSPDGAPALPSLPRNVAEALRGGPMAALADLDAAMPLVRDAASGVWETLQLEVHGHSGKAWLVVSNATGRREHVTTWGVGRVFAGVMEGWAATRRESVDMGTSWDVARRERRVVDYDGAPNVIDPGANRIVDIVTAAGGTTFTSCEGHPWGAYLGFRGAPAVVDVMQALGWTIDDGSLGRFVRMPGVDDVATRDRLWRQACTALEARLGMSVAMAEPERVAAA